MGVSSGRVILFKRHRKEMFQYSKPGKPVMTESEIGPVV
jgi:hypothetical protein